MSRQPGMRERYCSLLLFVATPAEENGLREAAAHRALPFEKIRDPELGEYHWLGPVGEETVIAVRPSREGGQLIMGSIGRLGSAAKAIRFQEATGARGIVQLGMAFGVNPEQQRLGDVLISTALIPYDNREIVPGPGEGDDCIVDYSQALPQRAREALVDLLVREKQSQAHPYGVHVGVMLSGSARFRCAGLRDQLVAAVPAGKDPVIGGEMEAIGLLAAATASSGPIWCVVKGISDFGDKDRDRTIKEGRTLACRNAAGFVLSALANEALA